MFLLLCIVCCTFVAVLLLWCEWRISTMNSKLKGYSGHPPKPIVGNILDFGFNTREKLFNVLKSVAENSSPYRIILGPLFNILIFKDADIFRDVLKNIHIFGKGKIFSIAEFVLKKGLITSEGDRWVKHRRLLTPSFHKKILDQFFDIFLIKTEMFVSILQKEKTKTRMEISILVDRLTFDIIIETAMGSTIDYQKQKNSEYFENLSSLQKILLKRITSAWLFFDFLFRLDKSYQDAKKANHVIESVAKEVIEKRRRIYEKNKNQEEKDFLKTKLAFLDLCFEIQQTCASFDDQDILEETTTFIIAGYETTSSAISFCLYSLAKYPEIQERLFEEISSILGNSHEKLTLKHLNQMDYLERVIKESLRMYPPVPGIPRDCKEDFTLAGGKCIPKGSQIILAVYCLHRNEKYWPEPEKFDPDRFLPEAINSRHPYAYLPFGTEPRKCLGIKYAMLELKTIICEVVRKFSLIDVNHQVDLSFDAILKSETGLIIEVELRK